MCANNPHAAALAKLSRVRPTKSQQEASRKNGALGGRPKLKADAEVHAPRVKPADKRVPRVD